MPAHTGALLTAEECLEFGAWLGECIERSGMSKSAVARDVLEDDSTQRLNRYLRGLIPTLPVLKKLVAHLPVLPTIALWRAGYFRELLGAIAELAEGRTTNADARLLAILFAVRGFPRRDTPRTSIFGTAEAMLGNIYSTPPEFGQNAASIVDLDRIGKLPLPPLLEHAAKALALSGVDAPTRRFLAAESINAWADKVDPDLSERFRQKFEAGVMYEFTAKTTDGKQITRFNGDSAAARAVWAPFTAPSIKFKFVAGSDPQKKGKRA
jgi:hypothetical protein